MSLIMWTLVFKWGLKHLKYYTDNIFSFSAAGNFAFYSPYNRWMPSEQVIILQLWDKINLPHEDTKQISGTIIPCIKFDVNPNHMTVTMIPAKWESLIEACQLFVTPERRSLWDFQWLAGHINWALNVYPRMQPATSALYEKITRKSRTFASICINNDICRELTWFTKVCHTPLISSPLSPPNLSTIGSSCAPLTCYLKTGWTCAFSTFPVMTTSSPTPSPGTRIDSPPSCPPVSSSAHSHSLKTRWGHPKNNADLPHGPTTPPGTVDYRAAQLRALDTSWNVHRPLHLHHLFLCPQLLPQLL